MPMFALMVEPKDYSVAVANFRAGAITNVAVIDSLVKGNDFVGALAVGWSIGDAYKAVDGAGDPINRMRRALINVVQSVCILMVQVVLVTLQDRYGDRM